MDMKDLYTGILNIRQKCMDHYSRHRKIIIALIISFLVCLVVIVVGIAYMVMCTDILFYTPNPAWIEKQKQQQAQQARLDQAFEAYRIQPLDRVAVRPANSDSTSEDAFSSVISKCMACHQTGIGGAPIVGNQAQWRLLISSGIDQLTRAAIEGKGTMPPKGGYPSLTDEQVREAVQWMIAQSTGS